MCGERTTLAGSFVHENFCSWDSERGAVEIKISVDGCIRRKFRLATRRSEVVESKVALWDKSVPFSEWKGRVDRGETSNEVVFPSLDGSFGGVATVAVGGNALEVDVMFCEGGLDF